MRLIDPTEISDIDAIEKDKKCRAVAVLQRNYKEIDEAYKNSTLDNVADYADPMAAFGGIGSSVTTYALNVHGGQ